MPTITEARMAKGKINVGYTDSNGDYQSTNIKGRANVANYLINQATNQANADLAKQQNDWNFEQWNRENEYNSPANQIALLKSAGLNPNLYQNDGATSSPLESADLANQQAGNPMQDLTQNYLNAFGLGLNNMNAALARELQRDQLNLEKLRVKNETDRAVSDISVNDTLKALNLSGVELNEERQKEIQQTIKESDQRISESSQRIQSMIQQGNLTQKQIDYFDTDKAFEYAESKVRQANGWKDLQVKASQIGLNQTEQRRVHKLIYQEAVKNSLYGQEFNRNKIALEILENDKEFKAAMNEHRLDTWWVDYGFNKFDQIFNWVTDAATLYYTKGVSGVFGKIRSGSNSYPSSPSPQSYRNVIDSYDSTADFLGR